MKNKQSKKQKLDLKKETVSVLNTKQLGKIIGGNDGGVWQSWTSGPGFGATSSNCGG
ncbi:MAG TPA: class I lanthipeptide [Chitinophagales bacterium]|nr:class I lanthipeptide [Chitinophagales bacterium]